MRNILFGRDGTGVMIFIGDEERQLTEVFGKTYLDYLASVDRLIPLRKPEAPIRGGN